MMLSNADFFQNLLFQKILSGTHCRVSTDLDPDLDRHSFGPDLGLNCLKILSTNHKSHC